MGLKELYRDEGSIPFTRSIHYQALTTQCSKCAVKLMDFSACQFPLILDHFCPFECWSSTLKPGFSMCDRATARQLDRRRTWGRCSAGISSFVLNLYFRAIVAGTPCRRLFHTTGFENSAARHVRRTMSCGGNGRRDVVTRRQRAKRFFRNDLTGFCQHRLKLSSRNLMEEVAINSTVTNIKKRSVSRPETRQGILSHLCRDRSFGKANPLPESARRKQTARNEHDLQ